MCCFMRQPYQHDRKKVQIGNDQEMAQSEINFRFINRGVENTLHKAQTAHNSNPKHKTIRTTTEVELVLFGDE